MAETTASVQLSTLNSQLEKSDTIAKTGSVVFDNVTLDSIAKDIATYHHVVLDVQDGKALCLSYYGLDAQPFNTVWAEVCWDGCTLRTWLNDEFRDKAFTAEEQAAILVTNVDNGADQGYKYWKVKGGNDTKN